MGIRIGIGNKLLPVYTPTLEAEAFDYNARVVADGGAVIDIWQVNADIVFLKSIGAFSTLDRIYLPYGGYKLRTALGVNYIAKYYDVKGAAGDAVQTTDAKQPIYGGTQINGYTFHTTVNANQEHLIFTGINIGTLIAVNQGTGYLGGITTSSSPYIERATLYDRYRSSSQFVTFTLPSAAKSVDSYIWSVNNAYCFRNKNVAPENPVASTIINMNTFYLRGVASAGYTGQAGYFLVKATAITDTMRNLIEDYLITKFALA